jgi:putative transposase
MGYKRLAWQMVDENVAFVTPYQTHQVFEQHDLFARRGRCAPDMLRRPPEATRPDQRWHVDLMYVWIAGCDRWYFLCDILDAYSRFLVHWRLNLTMQAEGVKLVVQEALDRLEIRHKDEPEIVHDHGSQFISGEWRKFIHTNAAKDIATKIAHPQSNGRLERLHRTHREEGLADEPPHSYHHAIAVFHKGNNYYNHRRPHSQLNYLCPVDYYRGDPATRLHARTAKLEQARLTRAAYWKGQSQP